MTKSLHDHPVLPSWPLKISLTTRTQGFCILFLSDLSDPQEWIVTGEPPYELKEADPARHHLGTYRNEPPPGFPHGQHSPCLSVGERPGMVPGPPKIGWPQRFERPMG